MLSNALPGKGIGSGLSREPVLVALDLASGKILWQRPFGRRIRLRPVVEYVPDENEARDALRPFDLNGYHLPFLVGDLVCVTYRGVDCYRAATGELMWQRRFPVVEDDLALAYANPLIDGHQLLATGNNRVYAVELATGDLLWRSSKSDYLPEIMADDELVYAQLGGRFFDLDRERWVWRGEFGAMAIDRSSGKKRWRFDDANDSVTNLLVLDDRVWLADEDRLISLSRSTGEVRLRVRHGLKDAPAFAVLNASKQLVLVSQSTAAAFDINSGEQIWQVRYPPPRPGVWRRLSAQLLQVSGTLLKLGSTAVSLSSGLVPSVPAIPVAGGLKLFSTSKLVSRTTGRVGGQFSDAAETLTQATEFADRGEHFQYFLTEVKGYDGVVMATVDINTGETVGLVALPASTPDIVVDAPASLLYQAEGAQLRAVPLRAGD
jgi:outer membrane protein assembly factor BamB